MNAPSSEALLQAWENGRQAHLVQRALALLDAAWPQVGLEAWSRVPIGERDAWLTQLRETLFGRQLQTIADCPACGERLESSFSTRDIRAPHATVPPLALFHWCESDCDIEYRLPTSEDLLAAAQDGLDGHGGAAVLLRRCVAQARRGGEVLDPAALPAPLAEQLGQAMRARDPAADIRIALECPACGTAWSMAFDIVSYLWDEIDDWAQQLLADVHRLARAYGWSEHDILALSPTRRQIYLDMVQA